MECSLRGKLRRHRERILVGDRVWLQPIDWEHGTIERIMTRQTELLRPPIANVDRVVLVCSLKDPPPDTWLLDRLLVLAAYYGVDSAICFNKSDLVSMTDAQYLMDLYSQAGFRVIATSIQTPASVGCLSQLLQDRVTVFAGMSGVGKSSLLNQIHPNLALKTGPISEKSRRGRHTTRHLELLSLDGGGLVADSPGFSATDLPEIAPLELASLFLEMKSLLGNCRFNSCSHQNEIGCAVRAAVHDRIIREERYKHYLLMLEEIKRLAKNRY